MIRRSAVWLLIAMSISLLPASDDAEISSSWWGILYPAYSGCDTESDDIEIRLKILDIIKNAPGN